MDHHQLWRNIAESLGGCGVPFGVSFTFERAGSACKHFRVVSSVQGGKLYVSFVYPTGQTHQLTTKPGPNVQMCVMAATDHCSIVFDDPRTQVVYDFVDDQESGIEVRASQRGLFVTLNVHVPHGSLLENAQQMPTVVSSDWLGRVALMRGYVRDEDVVTVARRRNMVRRDEVSRAAEGLGMMTPDTARKKGWVPPDDLAKYFEYVGPTDEEYNAALAEWEETLKPKAGEVAAVEGAVASIVVTAIAGEVSPLEAALDTGAAAPETHDTGEAG